MWRDPGGPDQYTAHAIVDDAVELSVEWCSPPGSAAAGGDALRPPGSITVRAKHMIKATGFNVQNQPRLHF